jgi:malonate transporter
MLDVWNSILPIFMTLMLGKIIKTYWLTSDEFWRGTEKLSYFLLFPCALFNYIVDANLNSNELRHLIIILITSSSLLIIGLLVYQNKCNVDGKIFTSIFQGSIRYNNYIFFGVGGALYKDYGLSIIAIVALYMIVFTNVSTIITFNTFLEKDKDSDYLQKLITLIKKFTLNPMIFASTAALIFNTFEITIGVSLKKLISNLSGAALTMGIITVGSGLQFSIKHRAHLKTIIIATVNKLLVLPIITFLLLSAFNIVGMPREIGLLYSGLPCATTSYILSKQLGGDSELMASIITFTTMFSIISLSFLMYILAK